MKKKKTTTPVESGVFEVGFHQGNVLTFLAAFYREAPQVILEMVQNSLDKNATSIVIHLRLGDRRSNMLRVLDNGNGASKTEMERRIGNIAARQKTDNKIGEKGIGNLAPLAIAGRYSMITRPRRGDDPFFRITFDKDGVRGRKEVSFGWEDMPSDFVPEEGKKVSTIITVRSIEASALRSLVRQENSAKMIADAISDRFSTRIQDLGANITVKVEKKDSGTVTERVTPQIFPGQREVVEITTPHGLVKFEMFISGRRQKEPKILVEHKNRHSFELKNMSDIWMEYADVFECGFIQGKIMVKFCTLTPDRNGFEWNEELESFIQAINDFCEQNGRPFLAQLEDVSRVEAWSDITREVLDSARQLIDQDPTLLPKDLQGLVSSRHHDADQGQNDGTKRRTKKKKKRSPDGGDEPTLKGSAQRIHHHSTESPSGRSRHRLRGEKGITIEFAEGSPERGYKWRVMIERGVILLNTTHEDWRQAEDKTKTHLRIYIGCLVARALALLQVPEDWREIFETCFDTEFMKWARLLVPQMGRRKKT